MDLFLAGLPAAMPKKASSMLLPAGGTFEVRVMHRGQHLQLHEGMKVEIEQPVTEKESYAVHAFSDSAGDWKQESHSGEHSEVVPEMKVEAPFSREELQASRPLPPRQASDSGYVFAFDIEQGEFPELEGYEDVDFEVNEAMTPFDPKVYEMEWEDINIHKLERPDEYELTLIRPDSQIRVGVRPVFSAMKMDRAQHEYEMKLARYESIQRYLEQKRTFEAENRQVYRSFQLDRCGIWNAGQPVSAPEGRTVNFVLEDEKGNRLESDQVFLVDITGGVLQPLTQDGSLTFDPRSLNLLLVVTTDKQFGFVSPKTLYFLPENKQDTASLMVDLSKDPFEAEFMEKGGL